VSRITCWTSNLEAGHIGQRGVCGSGKDDQFVLPEACMVGQAGAQNSGVQEWG